ncbi:MAG: efflux RND transporter periplasmic adaptor subunit [Phycisphaerae bacterium]|nr:efflux RND transporter periplasmic adaptor subunit [Phycisphaerae bacterium]
MRRVIVSGFGGWVRVFGTMLVVLAIGAAGGWWYFAKYKTGASVGQADATASAADDVWYTCGMHPQVLQREPGICPICNMKLTPMKQDSAEDEGEPSGPQERKILYWRAPMDPSYVSDRPGKSPMGMDLVPVYSDEGETVGGSIIRIDPVTIQNMGVRTTRVRRGPLVKTVRTVGRIDYDEQKLVFVDTKFEGWIEKLYVNETGQNVREGDPLFDVYSPDIYSAQVEYISAIRKLPTLERSTFHDAVEDARRMVDAARLKLEYFDVPSQQIERLSEVLTPVKTVQIHSPADGIVADKMALEGMRIMPGMRLFTIADLSRVWVYVDIYEYQLPWVHVGQAATMTLPYIPHKAFRGEVTYIYPYLQKQTRVIKVRLEFPNPTLELKPDMYANVVLEGLLKDDAVLVPREGFIDSGMRKVAFVDRGKGKYQPRDIQVGVEGEGGAVEVLLGLEPGDVVVTSGQFLLDSESKLKEAVAKMMEPSKATPKKLAAHEMSLTEPHGGHTQTSATTAPTDMAAHSHDEGSSMPSASEPSVVPADANYACPMDRHPDEKDPANRGAYFSAEPGECPLCGMKLKPIEELEWARAQLAAGGGDVAYTCPKHPHVFSESPGDCPVCGNKLQPFQALYACRNPKHSSQTSDRQVDCPKCGELMAALRGPWLGEAMAKSSPSGELPSDATPSAMSADVGRSIPSDARFVCPMQECWQFSHDEGRCPTCGMKLKPIEQVEWAERLVKVTPAKGQFVCPMHPDRATSDEPGNCPICAMQLLPKNRIVGLEDGGASVAQQVDYLMEHYLALQERFARDSTAEVALHALGLVDASEKLRDALQREAPPGEKELLASVNAVHAAALKVRGADLSSDRTQFAQLSAAMRTVISHQRPDSNRWPKLFIYRCPMAKADWIQTTEKKANPYYGFKMLDCGNLLETK